MEYQKFGRGGAGNIYSQEEAEVASKKAAEVGDSLQSIANEADKASGC